MKIKRISIKASSMNLLQGKNGGKTYAPIIGRDFEWLKNDIESYKGKNAKGLFDFLRENDFSYDTRFMSTHGAPTAIDNGNKNITHERWVLKTEAGEIRVVIDYEGSQYSKLGKVFEVFVYDEQNPDLIAQEEDRILNSTKTSKRPIRAARTETIQYLNFDELSDEQKDQAVKIFMESDTANRWFDDDMMDFYHDRVSEFAGTLYDSTGIKVDTKKLYWESSSHGPYPEWKLDEVLGDYDDNNGVSASFYGSLDAKFDTILIEEMGDSIAIGNQEFYDTKEVRDAGMPEIADQLDEVLAAVQAFVDAVWSEVNDVCTSYPDEEWCYGVLEANNYEFRVDDAGNVVSMA